MSILSEQLFSLCKRIAVAHVFKYLFLHCLLPKVQRLLAKDNSHMQLFATQLV